MKQTIMIRANDGETTISILAKIKTNGHLMLDENRELKVRLADRLMEALPGLIYTNFHISKIMIKSS